MPIKTPPKTPSLRAPGRGAITNRPGRFEPHLREAVADGWDRAEEDLPPLRTEVRLERPRSVITRNTSPDVPFDRSINPYRGCEHEISSAIVGSFNHVFLSNRQNPTL